MSDELRRELRREQGYTSILEGILSQRRPPRNPYLIFDTTGVIRFVSPNFEAVFKYKPEEVVGKHYEDFISSDLYEIALRELAYRIDVVRATPDKFDLPRFIERFRSDFTSSRDALSPDEKVSHIERMIKAYERKDTQDVDSYDSEVRVRLGDGRCATVKDKFWLRKHKTSHGWEYAAAMVELDSSDINPGYFTRFGRWVASWWDLKPYTITNERVIAINALVPSESGSLIRRLIEEESSPDKPLVLDFREVIEANERYCEGILKNAIDFAKFDRLIIGNAQEDIRKVMTAYVERLAKVSGKKPKYQLQFHKLVYPAVKAPSMGPESLRELKTDAELENYVEEGIRELEAFANKLPEEGLRGVQPGSQGEDYDVRSDSPSAEQQS